MTETLASLGERALIARLRARVGAPPPSVVIGIGDDAAVLRPGRSALEVVTTDSLVEGVHFRRDWTSAAAIGHKALAVNLSDLASMGAVPRAALLSLALPDDFPLADFDALLDGFLELAAASGTALVGGNLARSPGPAVIDVTAIGDAAPRRLLRRHTARASDELYVTGRIGGAAAGLRMLEAGLDRQAASAAALACIERYERPAPRLRCGRIVGRSRAATAAMDLSDGLADAARQIADASGLGVAIDAEALPLDDGARAWAEEAGVDATGLALTGGEDYELLFAVAPRHRNRFLGAMRRCPDLAVTRIGQLERTKGHWLVQNGARRRLGEGFSHFR